MFPANDPACKNPRDLLANNVHLFAFDGQGILLVYQTGTLVCSHQELPLAIRDVSNLSSDWRPFDVHVNRAPIAGKITDISYSKGKFLMATNERASLVNEQNALTIEGEKVNVVCKQIAGILARRIVCWKHKDDRVALGERIGMIKFSSRTDLILPGNVKVIAVKGAKVRGGTSIIGRIS